MAVIFPKIKKLVLHGFSKIFNKNDFEIDFSSNLSILLGGNGLGKTTLLQCIVYALTGGTDDSDIEESKIYRWNHNFFKGRINEDAYVQIYFYLGNVEVGIKRGFIVTRILECFVTNDGINMDTITFENAITEYGNYDSASDFSFIVNRLLYLPENRRSLLWDYDAQIRTLMIISNEFVVEQEYRSLRQLVKLKDSNKRKITWDIGRIEKRKSIQIDHQSDKALLKTSDEARVVYVDSKKDLLVNLEELTRESKLLYTALKSDQEIRNRLAESITQIGDKIRTAEADYIQQYLLERDEKNVLVFNKTIKTGYCPACDQKSENLKTLIQERLKNGECLICGENISKHNLALDPLDLESLNSQIYEKVSARNALEVKITQSTSRLTSIEGSISSIKDKLMELDSNYSSKLLDEEDENDDVDLDDEKLIAEEHVNLCQKQRELEIEIMQITKQADELYEAFIANFRSRYEQLHGIYSDLASKFLGLEVELKYIKSNAKFVSMDYLVPNFDNVDRDSPETCSEAQRFFLDIAFRMSVVALNREISGIDATFICETPENALDISYVDNVVTMFVAFMKKGGYLVLSNNLQYHGIAQSLISESRKNEIDVGVFDLLQYGKLSEIQSASKQLAAIRDAIVKEVTG